MSGRVRMVIVIIMSFILLSIISFILLAKFYPPLNRKLFGGEFEIPFDEIKFWVKKVPQRDYYRVYARYLKDPETELPEFGHGIYFAGGGKIGGWNIIFSNDDNKIYGGGWWEREVYYFGKGKITGELFKPEFPKGTKFTFIQGGSLEITSAPRYYIKIYFPGTLKKLENTELEIPSLREIIEEETKIKK
jgi:hypothetical protein